MSICSSALFGFRLSSFEAHARRAFELTKLDQLSGGASWQRRGHFIAKVRDRFQVVHRVEKTVERFAGESENLVESFVFGVDMRQQCGRREINARDAAVGARGGPSRTTVVRRRKVIFVKPSLADEIGLHDFKPFALSDDVAVELDGFVNKFL